tara:strand:- start:2811 stop:2969 length:159 start_codon:yes stop_codon:yes gene_type:complete
MSGILISGKINAVIPTETNILTCIGTKAVEKNGELISIDEILKEAKKNNKIY